MQFLKGGTLLYFVTYFRCVSSVKKESKVFANNVLFESVSKNSCKTRFPPVERCLEDSAVCFANANGFDLNRCYPIPLRCTKIFAQIAQKS